MLIVDHELMTELRKLPKDSDEQREILALLDCYFMSTAMLRITQTPPEQLVILEHRITDILKHARRPTV